MSKPVLRGHPETIEVNIPDFFVIFERGDWLYLVSEEIAVQLTGSKSWDSLTDTQQMSELNVSASIVIDKGEKTVYKARWF